MMQDGMVDVDGGEFGVDDRSYDHVACGLEYEENGMTEPSRFFLYDSFFDVYHFFKSILLDCFQM